jgi:AcrR family transcriptional regulator
MPPKMKFDHTAVLDTAFGILKKKGWSSVTARSIAKALKASTMPVYSALGSMQALEKKLKQKAYAVFADFQSKAYTDNDLLNMAVGQVLFARDEPFLYRFLHFDSPVPLSSKEQKDLSNEVAKRLGRPIPYNKYLGSITTDTLDNISIKSWIFTHGLSMGIMNGNVPSMDDTKIIALLREAGGAFVSWESSKK